ncbi:MULTISPECIES: IS3 family transposase [Collinsella]
MRHASARIIQRITWQRTQTKLKGLTPEEFRSQSLAA